MNYASRLDHRITSAGDVLDCKDILQEIIADRIYINSRLIEYFERVAKNPLYYPIEISGTNMSLMPTEVARPYGLSISYHDQEPLRTMTSHVAYVLLSPLNRSVEIDLYDAPDDWNPDIFKTDIHITKAGHTSLQPGQVIAVKPEDRMLHFQFQGPTALIKIHSQPISTFEWSFNLDSGRAWQSIFAIPADSNTAHACIVARALADPRLVTGLTGLLENKCHQLRWTAAQALGRIGRSHGIDAMQYLKDDAHPEIAAAARNILNNIIIG
ncbi:MAG TPA: HEAT repeat domain-containing protein [Burkholderiaceae bacterium]|jgi:hypothetical protein